MEDLKFISLLIKIESYLDWTVEEIQAVLDPDFQVATVNHQSLTNSSVVPDDSDGTAPPPESSKVSADATASSPEVTEEDCDNYQSLTSGSVESGDQLPSLTCVSGERLLSLASKSSGDTTGDTQSPESSKLPATATSTEVPESLTCLSGDTQQSLGCDNLLSLTVESGDYL